ncbi:hypothetical protein M9H77_28187 [Catharanthus roseus]|uniref:Uncharacterized protein n=1 Tax=Catharanthus roseus TaxID=4058 RepID=A0ACC0AF02_CATRO|nr:hypothetical protein M9H77_28187 [Catharanthus roseus]
MLPYCHRGMNFGQSLSYYLWAGKLPGKTILSFTSDQSYLIKVLSSVDLSLDNQSLASLLRAKLCLTSITLGFLALLSNAMIGPLDLRSSLQLLSPSLLQLAINLINIGCRRLSLLTLPSLFSLIFYLSISFRLNVCAYLSGSKFHYSITESAKPVAEPKPNFVRPRRLQERKGLEKAIAQQRELAIARPNETKNVGIRAALYASPSTGIHTMNSSASDRDASPFCVLKTVQN